MNSQTRLADALIRDHPDRAAAVLERISMVDATRVLSSIRVGEAAIILQRMSPLVTRSVLERLPIKRIRDILDVLEVDVCARLARQMDGERRQAVFEGLSPRKTQSLTRLLMFPENSAGALMDPDVLALAEDLTARDALTRIRQTPRNAHYNLYVVDRQGVLVGALNLRELFLAHLKARLADLMVPNPFRVDAHATRSTLVAHPGWKVVHSLPVVDENDHYVGAVRYSMLRALEQELFERTTADGDAGGALGRLFAVGATGLVAAVSPPERLTPGRD